MKNCLVVLKNKKLPCNTVDYSVYERAFASEGFYFDKIAVIAYDSSRDITLQLNECKEEYENTLITCPCKMEGTLKQFLENLYAARFDMARMIDTPDRTVFLHFYDGKNAVSVAEIAQYIGKKFNVKYGKSIIKAVGAPEADVLAAVENAKQVYPQLNCNIYSEYGDCRIEILYLQDAPKMMCDEATRIILTDLDSYVYALEDISLAQRLYQLLKLRRMKICVAESFTGGGVGKKLVEVPGISEVYFEGLNTYSNQSKISRLGVNEYTIQSTGAVSEETAREMAEGLLSQGNCDVAVATTGIAGPKSDNTNKPVGLCYISVATKAGTAVTKFVFNGGRDAITNTAINYALFLVYKHIK